MNRLFNIFFAVGFGIVSASAMTDVQFSPPAEAAATTAELLKAPTSELTNLTPAAVTKTTNLPADIAWTDWELFQTGSVSLGQWMGISPLHYQVLKSYYPEDVKVYMRSDTDNPARKQYRINNLFKKMDFIATLNPETGRLEYDRQATGIVDQVYQGANLDQIYTLESSEYRYGVIDDYKIEINTFLLYTENENGKYGNDYIFSVNFHGKKEKTLSDYFGWDVDDEYGNIFGKSEATVKFDPNEEVELVTYMVFKPSGTNIITLDGETLPIGTVWEALDNPDHKYCNTFTSAGGSKTFSLPADGVYQVYAQVALKDGTKPKLFEYLTVNNSHPEEWKSIGKGRFREPTVEQSDKVRYTWIGDFNFEANIHNPNLIRVKNPFNYNLCLEDGKRYYPPSAEELLPGYFWYDYKIDRKEGHDYYLTFDISNPEKPMIIQGGTPVRTSSCGNPVYGMNWTSTLGYGDGTPDAEKHLRQGAIRHRNGLVIELPESMQFAITLDEKKVKVDKRPDNVKKVYVNIVEKSGFDFESARDEMKKRIDAGTWASDLIIDLTSRAASSVDISSAVEDYRDYLLLAMACDSEGNIVATDVADVYFTDPSQYKYMGMSTYEETTMAGILDGFSTETYQVETFMDPNTPGVYYLRNLYAFNGCRWSQKWVNGTEQTYLVLHCEDPNHVWFENFDTGLTYDSDKLRFNSWPHIYHLNNPDDTEGLKSQSRGTLSTYSGYIYIPSADYYVSAGDDMLRSSAFMLTLPESYSGIGDTIADSESPDTPAVYYNLQGIEVAKPVPGQIYIKRQGSKTVKVLFSF